MIFEPTRKKATGNSRKLHTKNKRTCVISMIKRAKIGGKYSTNGGDDKGPSIQEFGVESHARDVVGWKTKGVYGRTI